MVRHGSEAWKHFRISELDQSKVRCLLCFPDCSLDGTVPITYISRGTKSKSFSTTPLWNHLKSKHKAVNDTLTQQNEPIKFFKDEFNQLGGPKEFINKFSEGTFLRDLEDTHSAVKESVDGCFDTNQPIHSKLLKGDKTSTHFSVKKKSHTAVVLNGLLKDEMYTDVILSAEGRNLRAHKVVLSLSSAYFRDVLSADPRAHNIIILKDTKFTDLENVINFIYTGEVILDASSLESFMVTASSLSIDSLKNTGSFESPSQTSVPRSRKRPTSPVEESSSKRKCMNSSKNVELEPIAVEVEANLEVKKEEFEEDEEVRNEDGLVCFDPKGTIPSPTDDHAQTPDASFSHSLLDASEGSPGSSGQIYDADYKIRNFDDNTAQENSTESLSRRKSGRHTGSSRDSLTTPLSCAMCNQVLCAGHMGFLCNACLNQPSCSE